MTDDEVINRAVLWTDENLTGSDLDAFLGDVPADVAAATRRDAKQFTRLPGWVRLGILSALAAWDSDDPARKCPHDPDTSQTAQGAAWLPDYVVCEECTHLLGESRRCDRCGAEPDGDHQLQAYVLVFGRFTYHLTTCGGCRLPDMTR